MKEKYMIIKRGTLSKSYVKWTQSVFDNIIRRNIFKCFCHYFLFNYKIYKKRPKFVYNISHRIERKLLKLYIYMDFS